ncbi:Conserved_hypothetical protein [Hexamita inflata]|uniref:Uncharacterized protein n=1 Tax=Hexamita inflata TaxID=28002 RepID=A0ABP1HIH6_9EUKA
MMYLLANIYNGITTEIDAQTELEGCYSELSRVVLKEDQAQICVQLISAGNSSCKKLPKGVKVTVELDNLSGFYTPTGYFSDFNYSSTTELCVSCSNQACIDKVFFESKTASAVIESYGLKAPVAVGVVIREQLNLENCIKEVKLIVSKTQMKLSIELQDYCMQLLNNNKYQICSVMLLEELELICYKFVIRIQQQVKFCLKFLISAFMFSLQEICFLLYFLRLTSFRVISFSILISLSTTTSYIMLQIMEVISGPSYQNSINYYILRICNMTHLSLSETYGQLRL